MNVIIVQTDYPHVWNIWQTGMGGNYKIWRLIYKANSLELAEAFVNGWEEEAAIQCSVHRAVESILSHGTSEGCDA